MNWRHLRCLWIGTGLGLTLLGVAGCATFEYPSERDVRLEQERAMELTLVRLNQESARHNREIAALRADVQALLDDRHRLRSQLEAVCQESANAARQTQELQERLGLAERQLSAVDADYRKRLQEMQKAIAQEGAAREKGMKEVISSVSKEISQTASQLQAEQRKLLKSLSEGPGAQGDYVVQQGDTLGNIGEAFGVTVDALKKANKLGGSTIKIGQRLVIPAK
jgi:LysM repeat protein